MGNKDYENFKKELASGKQVSFIKLREFRLIGPYSRREFIGPRNVTINSDNTISFDVEDWATFKSITITVPVSDISVFYF